jgi:p-aminobenzoyl-glutamate transporter AbgT
MSVAGMQWILPNVIHNFSGFAPLGAILALVIGAGLAERVGLLQSADVQNGLDALAHAMPVTWCFLSPSSATFHRMPRWW